jgi:hypothetical protein
MGRANIGRTVRRTLLVAAAGSAVAVAGAAVAGATVGDPDGDGTQGVLRTQVSQTTASHTVQSDACAIVGKGCLPADGGPHVVSATTGFKNGPDGALDGDGYQADRVDTSGIQGELR